MNDSFSTECFPTLCKIGNLASFPYVFQFFAFQRQRVQTRMLPVTSIAIVAELPSGNKTLHPQVLQGHGVPETPLCRTRPRPRSWGFRPGCYVWSLGFNQLGRSCRWLAFSTLNFKAFKKNGACFFFFGWKPI